MAISISVNMCDFRSYEVTISSPVEPDGGDHYCFIYFGDPALAYLFSVKLDGVTQHGSCGMYFTSAGESYTLEVKLLVQDPSAVPSMKWLYVVHGLYAPAWADIEGMIILVPNFDPCCECTEAESTTEVSVGSVGLGGTGATLLSGDCYATASYGQTAVHYAGCPFSPDQSVTLIEPTAETSYTVNSDICGWDDAEFNVSIPLVAPTMTSTEGPWSMSSSISVRVRKEAGSHTVYVKIMSLTWTAGGSLEIPFPAPSFDWDVTDTSVISAQERPHCAQFYVRLRSYARNFVGVHMGGGTIGANTTLSGSVEVVIVPVPPP